MSAVTHVVLGTEIPMPVRIRSARCFVAGFSASARAVRDLVAAGGDVPLEPMLIRPGRALCMLVFVEYVDGDLGPYHEFGVCFLIQDPDGPRRSPLGALGSLAAGDAHALVHRLPVDGHFTLAAGREIWGFPKTLAEFDVDHGSPTKSGTVAADGCLIARLDVKRGLRVPDSTSQTVLQAYARLDGVTRRTPWRLTSTSGTRTRIGGATLTLGDHPIAAELAGLGLSRRAWMSSSVADLSMSFDDAVVAGGPNQR